MRPPTRSRLRPYILLTLAALTLIYLFTGARSSQTSDFYTRTVAAMDARRQQQHPATGGAKDDAASSAMQAVEAKVRGSKGEQIRLEPVPDHEGGRGEQVGHKIAGGSSSKQSVLEEGAEEEEKKGSKKAAGSSKKKTYEKDEEEGDAVHGPKDEKKVKAAKGGEADDGVAKVGNTEKKKKPEAKEGKGDAELDALLDGVLKKSPIIIFSKSYCPYSKKAKHILLDKYTIVPAPYVHEIDLMDEGKGDEPLAKRLQDKLFEMTKRRTVPNVLVNGVSIGGGDDIQALDESDGLAEKLMEIGGKRIMEVKKAGGKEKTKPKPKA